MKIFFLLLVCFLAGIQTSFAQKNNIKKADGSSITDKMIDSTVKKLMDTAEVTGLCIGIINNDHPVYVKGYGFKNKATNQLNDTSSCFQAASLAKPLFAYTVMQLVQDGVIDLDKPLYTYLPKPLPEYENYKELAGDNRWKLITARHCLSHTTGFPNWRNNDPNNMEKMGIFFTPGTHYAYSGEGIQLLQMVIETITHRSLEDIAKEKVFIPFHMTRTSFLWQPKFENNYAVAHGIEEDTLHKDRFTQAHAAGSMETTIADYTRFVAGVLQHKNLSAQFWNEIFTPQIAINSAREFPSLNTDTSSDNKKIGLAYGLGWGLFQTPYGKAFFKEGHGNGWVHYMIAVPQQKFALVIMSNSVNGESIFAELIQKLAGITIPAAWEGYAPYRATAKLTDAQLKEFTGTFHGDKLDAIITLVDGVLKVEAPKADLPPTTIHAQNGHHLFLKIMEADLEFVKGPDGKFDKAIVDDEGEHYELTRIK